MTTFPPSCQRSPSKSEGVLRNASVEWREVEEGKAGREALRRSAR